MERIEIKRNTKKLRERIAGCSILFFLGIWLFFFMPQGRYKNSLKNPYIRYITAGFLVAFNGVVLVRLIKRLKSKTPGLIIDNTGILCNLNQGQTEYAKWEEIIDITTVWDNRIQFLKLTVKDNKSNNSNQLIGYDQEGKLAYNGSKNEIRIAENALSYDFFWLKDIVFYRWEMFKQKTKNVST